MTREDVICVGRVKVRFIKGFEIAVFCFERFCFAPDLKRILSRFDCKQGRYVCEKRNSVLEVLGLIQKMPLSFYNKPELNSILKLLRQFQMLCEIMVGSEERCLSYTGY